jgi:hypothetical protein
MRAEGAFRRTRGRRQNEDLFGVARLFEMFTRRAFTRSRVFATTEDAEIWLESPTRPRGRAGCRV